MTGDGFRYRTGPHQGCLAGPAVAGPKTVHFHRNGRLIKNRGEDTQIGEYCIPDRCLERLASHECFLPADDFPSVCRQGEKPAVPSAPRCREDASGQGDRHDGPGHLVSGPCLFCFSAPDSGNGFIFRRSGCLSGRCGLAVLGHAEFSEHAGGSNDTKRGVPDIEASHVYRHFSDLSGNRHGHSFMDIAVPQPRYAGRPERGGPAGRAILSRPVRRCISGLYETGAAVDRKTPVNFFP